MIDRTNSLGGGGKSVIGWRKILCDAATLR
jgi:hypothetical protein